METHQGNRITLGDVEVASHEIRCAFRAEGEVLQAFKKKSGPYFFYQCNASLEGLPKSIAVVPLLAQLLPIAWIYDATIEAPECDKDFLEAIPEFKQGYRDMWAHLSFDGELKVASAVENRKELEGAMCLFSGGLDATDTALRHAGEKPSLLIVRGNDINLRNDTGWAKVLERVDSAAEMLGSSRFSVESNFRTMLNYSVIDKKLLGKKSDTWWHGMQHGIGLLSLAAPIAWCEGIRTVYIASSYTEGSEGSYTCASDPSIDNHVRFGGSKCIHDGYSYSRLDKLRSVASWRRENSGHVHLRVCASTPITGDNCCDCEKCFRTMAGLYAIGEDPSLYGFDKVEFDVAMDTAHRDAYKLLRNFNHRWGPIIDQLRETYTPETIDPALQWLYNFELSMDSELFGWINRRVVLDRNRGKKLAVEVKRLEARNANLQGKCDELEAKLADTEAKLAEIYRKHPRLAKKR